MAMMQFVFPLAIQLGIAAQQYEVVHNAAGVALGIARNKATGQFVGHAVGAIGNGGIPMNPLTAGMQFAQMYQMHQGSQAVQVGLSSIQASLGVLQTMTALTGVGVAANIAISAASLWQILKLREDVRQQRVEIKEGFLDLKHVLGNQSTEIIQEIGNAVQDIEFRQHRQALAQAYGRFLEATRLIRNAVLCEDLSVRNDDLAHARQILTESLADYRNPHLLPDTDAVTNLRRSECTWVIEQSIASTYQLQNQSDALSNCLGHLQDRIRQDVVAVVDLCKSEDELEVIFPEILRVHDQDLAILKTWQDYVDWTRFLSSDERKSLEESPLNMEELGDLPETPVDRTKALPEQALFEELKQKSHFAALRDVLYLMFQSKKREEYSIYIEHQASKAEHKSLTFSNLVQMSDLSIANLYWYFEAKDISEQEAEVSSS